MEFHGGPSRSSSFFWSCCTFSLYLQMSVVNEASTAFLGNKPMAISSIISGPLDQESDNSRLFAPPPPSSAAAPLPPPSSCFSAINYPSTSSTSSTSSSSLDDELCSSLSPLPSRRLFLPAPNTHRYQHHQVAATEDSNGSSHPTTGGSLSLQERRQRNKAASAKYRAKKNQQYGEMRNMITTLTKENELLSRQLEHVKRENIRLRSTYDRLRGKTVAAKILKHFLTANNSKQEQSIHIEQDDDDESDQ